MGLHECLWVPGNPGHPHGSAHGPQGTLGGLGGLCMSVALVILPMSDINSACSSEIVCSFNHLGAIWGASLEPMRYLWPPKTTQNRQGNLAETLFPASKKKNIAKMPLRQMRRDLEKSLKVTLKLLLLDAYGTQNRLWPAFGDL